jgi:hypothetical protein
MRKTLGLLGLAILLAGCATEKTSRAPLAEPREWALGKPPETIVMEKVRARDRDLDGLEFHDTKFIRKPAGRGRGYVMMTSAYGTAKSQGARETWLYELKGSKARRMFRLPFDATSIKLTKKKGAPAVAGYYWAYECTVCDAPEAGYLVKVPVVAVKEGKTWHMVANVPSRDWDYLEREAKLVVQSAKTKYGEDKEAQRMERQVRRLFNGRNAADRSVLKSKTAVESRS